MSKQKNRRIGLGMEPRGNAAKMAPGAPVSRESAHEEVAEEVEMEVVLGEQKGEGLELRGVQNLDSGQLEAAGDTGGDTIVAHFPVFEPKSYGPALQVDPETATALDAMIAASKEERLAEATEAILAPDDPRNFAGFETTRTISFEEAAKMGYKMPGGLDIKFNAERHAVQFFQPEMGELSNGEYRATVRIAECYVEGCRQQAEADGVSLEDWLTGHLHSYLEGWWAMPGSR